MSSAAELPCEASPRGRILVVDDNRVNREVIRAALEPFGFAVSQAASVCEGLALARQGGFDLILSDLHMPEQDGFHFLLAARNDPVLRATPFLIITSSVWGERDKPRALSLGALRFILRPVEPQCLLAEIDACLPSGNQVLPPSA